jgi:hypothetical protein
VLDAVSLRLDRRLGSDDLTLCASLRDLRRGLVDSCVALGAPVLESRLDIGVECGAHFVGRKRLASLDRVSNARGRLVDHFARYGVGDDRRFGLADECHRLDGRLERRGLRLLRLALIRLAVALGRRRGF